MAYLDWSDSYSVGIKKIDLEHQKLVAFLNELYDAMQGGKGKDVLGKVLENMVAYTKTHFATEERLMAQHKFPEYEEHKAVHEKMASKVLELNQQYQSGALNSPIQITNFLKNWLSKHINETDKKYGPYLAGKGVT